MEGEEDRAPEHVGRDGTPSSGHRRAALTMNGVIRLNGQRRVGRIGRSLDRRGPSDFEPRAPSTHTTDVSGTLSRAVRRPFGAEPSAADVARGAEGRRSVRAVPFEPAPACSPDDAVATVGYTVACDTEYRWPFDPLSRPLVHRTPGGESGADVTASRGGRVGNRGRLHAG